MTMTMFAGQAPEKLRKGELCGDDVVTKPRLKLFLGTAP